MMMHHGIGLERFNSLPRTRAVHALFECCCNVTWATKLADGRPYPSHEALFKAGEAELDALSSVDLERVFDSCVHEPVSAHTVEELTRVTRTRLETMLGPADGYPEY